MSTSASSPPYHKDPFLHSRSVYALGTQSCQLEGRYWDSEYSYLQRSPSRVSRTEQSSGDWSPTYGTLTVSKSELVARERGFLVVSSQSGIDFGFVSAPICFRSCDEICFWIAHNKSCILLHRSSIILFPCQFDNAHCFRGSCEPCAPFQRGFFGGSGRIC